MPLLAQARRRPSLHPPDLRPPLPSLPHPRAAVYSHAELQYLEHGSGPLAAELGRLWRVRGAGKRRTVRAAAGSDAEGWPALPEGAAGPAPRRPQGRTVTELYYPGLQDPPPGQDGRNAGSGQ